MENWQSLPRRIQRVGRALEHRGLAESSERGVNASASTQPACGWQLRVLPRHQQRCCYCYAVEDDSSSGGGASWGVSATLSTPRDSTGRRVITTLADLRSGHNDASNATSQLVATSRIGQSPMHMPSTKSPSPTSEGALDAAEDEASTLAAM